MNVFNVGNVIRDGARVYIVDGHRRHAVLGNLQLDPDIWLDWTRDIIELFVTMRADGTPLSSLEVMKNITLLNTASSKSLPCVDFLDVLRAIISYSRTFNKC